MFSGKFLLWKGAVICLALIGANTGYPIALNAFHCIRIFKAGCRIRKGPMCMVELYTGQIDTGLVQVNNSRY